GTTSSSGTSSASDQRIAVGCAAIAFSVLATDAFAPGTGVTTNCTNWASGPMIRHAIATDARPFEDFMAPSLVVGGNVRRRRVPAPEAAVPAGREISALTKMYRSR